LIFAAISLYHTAHKNRTANEEIVMRTPPVSLAGLSAAQAAQLKALTATPLIAWPAVIVYCLLMSATLGCSALALSGAIPLWVAMVVNGLAGYWVFTVGHDGVHRALSTHARLNDFIGQSSLWLLGPYVNLKLFRWCHILHHRYANGPKDPDRFFKGAWWSLPLRWVSVDFYYFWYVLRHGDRISRPYLREAAITFALTVAVAIWLTRIGYGVELLMLWFIPSRVAFGLMGFSFFWLPHVPHDTTQEDNFTRATTVRLGHDRLMTFLLQFHHVHLIHHLFPMSPSHHNGKVWALIEAELRKNELAIQQGFAIRPVIRPADAVGA
jgi:beta-carotene hydroxylase